MSLSNQRFSAECLFAVACCRGRGVLAAINWGWVAAALVVVTSGCASGPSKSAGPDFAAMSALQPGEWCRVETGTEASGIFTRHTRYVGRVKRKPEGGLVLSDATMEVSSESSWSKTPLVGGLVKSSVMRTPLSTDLTIALAEVRGLERLSADEAQALAKPYAENLHQDVVDGIRVAGGQVDGNGSRVVPASATATDENGAQRPGSGAAEWTAPKSTGTGLPTGSATGGRDGDRLMTFDQLRAARSAPGAGFSVEAPQMRSPR